MTNDQRARLRDLNISIGRYPTGTNNAITDIPGVLVGQKTVIRDHPSVVRSGVTVIMPRDGNIHEDFVFAGFHSFNGVGEMTGMHLLEEWGLLSTPIVLTNTNQVGMAMDAISRYGAEKYGGFAYKLPVIAETYDGYLNDMDAFPLSPQDVIEALESAAPGRVLEGSVGGGTGMICYDFKGGIGTSSRIVEIEKQNYTIGALVQANHGSRHSLRVNGVEVGVALNTAVIPAPGENGNSATKSPGEDSSSILVILATDAPLLPVQCKRLARRATVGLARTGGMGYNSSGDLFLAFSTGNHYDRNQQQPIDLQMLPHAAMNPLIEAAAEAVEEAILNALTSAVTITGYKGRTAHAIPLEALKNLVHK